MHALDYMVLIIYLLGTLAVGLVFAAKNKTSEDMFSAGGESPWWASGLSAYMTMFSAGTFVVWGGIAYKHGLVAVTINCCYGIAAFFVGYFVAGRWKSLGVGTPAEFIELRFGAKVVMFYTWSMMIFRIVGTAVALYALSVILVSMMPLADGNPLQDPLTGNLSVLWAVLIFGCIVVLYTMIGGLWAVLMTDVLQFIVLTIAVLLIVPLIWSDVGGWSGFTSSVPEDFFSPVSDDYTLLFMVGWVLIHLFMIGAEWAFTQRFISVSSVKDAKKSAYLFGALYLVSPFLWMLPPMMYRAIDPAADPEQAYMLASRSVLPVGMVGLMVAAMFSATASMVSSQLNVFAGVLTENFYQKYFKPDASERAQVFAGRIFTVLIGAVLISIAIAVPYMGGAEKIIVSLTSLLVVPLMAPTLWGLLGRRINHWAVWITAGVCFTVSVIVKFGLSADGWLSDITSLSSLQAWVQGNPKDIDILLGAILPVIVLVVVQWLTKAEAEGARKVDAFIALNRHKPQSSPSLLPSLIVSIALAGLSVMFYGIAFVADEKQQILFYFATTLVLISLSILFFRRRLARPKSNAAV